jgi:hypothetical protein
MPTCGYATLSCSPFQGKLELHTFRLLQSGQDAGEVRGRGAALWTEHAHQAIGRDARAFFEIVKTNCGVDIVAEHRPCRLRDRR